MSAALRPLLALCAVAAALTAPLAYESPTPDAGPAPCHLSQVDRAWSGTEPSGEGGQVRGIDWICNDGTWNGPFAPLDRSQS